MKAVSVSDFRELARRRLPRFLFDYIDGGSYAEVTLRRNIEDLERVALRQRVLRDVSQVDLTTELLGQACAMPVVLGPVGLAGMNSRRGEVQAACAAERALVPFCLSTVSVCSLEEVTAHVSAPIWLQIYIMRDRAFIGDLLDRAQRSGCGILVLTVDMPVPGSRYRDYRSGLAGAPGMKGAATRLVQALAKPRWAFNVGIRGRPLHLGNVAPLLGRRTGLEDFFWWMARNFDATVTWADVEMIRSRWSGKLVIKGILDKADAVQAASLGVDGIVVSNHGGRQLDGVLSTASALPQIANAVGDRLTVLADGGVRSGLDVVKLLALGARGVLLGRAWAFALAAGGYAGVGHLLQLVEAEMRVALALTGCTSIPAVNQNILVGGEPAARS